MVHVPWGDGMNGVCVDVYCAWCSEGGRYGGQIRVRQVCVAVGVVQLERHAVLVWSVGDASFPIAQEQTRRRCVLREEVGFILCCG